jgi:hypothetical protein
VTRTYYQLEVVGLGADDKVSLLGDSLADSARESPTRSLDEQCQWARGLYYNSESYPHRAPGE